MAATTIQVRTISGIQSGTGWSGQQPVVVGRSAAVGGDGLGYSGGELLALAVGACFYNNLYFAADKRKIHIHRAEVEVSCNWTEEPVVSSGITISATVDADASKQAIEALIRHAGDASTVSNTLRQETSVELKGINVIAPSD